MSKSGSNTWKELLRTALTCLDSLEKAGIQTPRWTLGGGTVLMLRYDHRVSRDVDVFLPDPQYLPALSPRLNDTAAALTEEYQEGATNLRLAFPAGEIDFIVAPDLLGLERTPIEFEGHSILTDPSAEIIAKKLFYRTAALKVRDCFDAAVVLENAPATASQLADLLAPKKGALLRRLETLRPVLENRMDQEILLLDKGRALMPDVHRIVRRFFESLPGEA